MTMASNKTQTQLHHHHDFTQLNQIYSHHHQDFGMMHPSSSSTPFSANLNIINKNAGASYVMPDMDDQTLFMFINGENDHAAQNPGMTPPTLNIFPSQPMHVDPPKASGSGLVSPGTSGSNKSSEPYMELSNPNSDVAPAPQPHKVVKREGNRRGNSSGNERPQADLDPKILRRLAQNREAARKSRLRKKAYVQQLEASRLKLVQLEQELQRARSQGSLLFGGNNLLTGEQGSSSGSRNSDAAVFDMEYSRWVEIELRMMVELQKAVQDRFPEHELQVFVDKYLKHYDQLINLKSVMVNSDVFHILSGMWKTPAERCLMWLGDFRPSDIVKISISTLKPMTETQYVLLCGLQQSTTETEAAISKGLEAFNNSLSETITSGSESLSSTTSHPSMSYMGSMSLAFDKLSSLEGFVRQADDLRQDTLHQFTQMLTPYQVSRCLLAMVEYFHRLRNLNSIWVARSRQE